MESPDDNQTEETGSKKHTITDDLENEKKKVTKKVRLFSAKQFRKQLNSNEKLSAIQAFLKAVRDEHHDYVCDYLENGGNCLELLQILELDSTVSPSLIFELVNHVLLQIISNYPQYQSAAQEACRYMLSTYISLINKMLNLSSSGQERRVVLKLLTTVATFSAGLAKDILFQVNFHQTNLELLTKHTGEQNNVRDIFIHFLTAFLVDGHYPTIIVLLEKRGLLTSIISGLQYDAADTVCIVLTAMKNHILENPLMSKTTKMKTFNTLVVRDIVNLYNWKGPAAFKAQKKSKSSVSFQVDEYAKSKVSECVHDFLLVLCTSHKYGVIFRDPLLGLGKKNQNSLMYTVLQSLERPWEHSYAGQLVTKICGACPGLTITMWGILKPFLELRTTKKWLNAMKFAKRLLGELQPSCIEFSVSELSVCQWGQMVILFTAPMPILNTIIPKGGVYEQQSVKQNVILLLLDMLRAMDSYLTASKSWLAPADFQTLKGVVHNYLALHFLDAKTMLINWELEESLDDHLVDDTIRSCDYLSGVLDIFNYYKDLCPQLLETIDVSELKLHDFLGQIEDKCGETSQELQLKLISIFFDFDQAQFAPKNELFALVLPVLLKIYHETQNPLSMDVAKKILSNTGIFEGCDYEINIWLNAVLNVRVFDEALPEILVEILRKTHDNLLDYLRVLSECRESDAAPNDHAELLENLFMSISVDHHKIVVKTKHLSPLIVGFLEYLQENDPSKFLKPYLNFAMLVLFHSQTSCNTFSNLFTRYDVPVKNIAAYVQKWGGEQEPCGITKFKGRFELFQSFSESFFSETLDNFVGDPEHFNDYSDMKLNLLQACIFYFVNLLNFGQLSQKHAENCERFIKNLTKNDAADGSCYETVLGHPVLLQNFSLLHLETEKSRGFCTKFIVNTIKEWKNSGHNIEMYLKVYRKKIVETIVKVLKKPQKYSKLAGNVVEILQVFNLDYNDIAAIFEFLHVIDHSEANQVVYDVTVHCLDHMAILCDGNSTFEPLDEKIIEDLNSYFVHLNETQQINVCSFSMALTNYLGVFPHQVKAFHVGFLKSLLTLNEFHKENVALAVFLLQNNPALLDCIKENVSVVCEKKAIILPLLNVLVHGNCDEGLLRTIFQLVEAAVAKALQKPQKAGQNFVQYYQGVDVLLAKFMDGEKCKSYMEKVQKFETTEVFHAKFLSTMFGKVIDEGVNAKQVNNILLIFVHLQMNLFKRKSRSEDESGKLNEVARIFHGVLEVLIAKNLVEDLKSVTQNETFKMYCKFCLKLGVSGTVIFLEVLRKLLELLSTSWALPDAKLLLNLCFSHSEFLEKVLGQPGDCKSQILSLILVLCQKWNELMEREHIPVFLSAYTATISHCDRTILALLKMYEQNSNRTQFYEFKPFLWGRAAATHYSIRSKLENSLWRQPKMGDILGILENSHVLSTINCYPLDDGLDSTGSPADSVKNERFIYDLGFLLPLFGQLLAPENQVQTYLFSRSGALSMTVAGLGSQNKEVRQAACYVLSRYYLHLEARQTGKDNLLWIRYVEAVCKGTAVLPDFKLNSFAAIYLARVGLVLSQPNHVMYVPLTQYLGAKTSLDFNTIPELYTFLHSSDVNFKDHRTFLLELLRDGLRTNQDFVYFQRSMAFKLFSELYSSTISDLDAKKLILDVVAAICVLPVGVKVMCEHNSLLTQLTLMLTSVRVCADQKKEAHIFVGKIIQILFNISKVALDKHSSFMVFNMLADILLEDDFQVKPDETLRIFYETLYLVYTESPELFEDKHFDALLRRYPDKLCRYVYKYGCGFNRGHDVNDTGTVKYLRLLFFDKFKR